MVRKNVVKRQKQPNKKVKIIMIIILLGLLSFLFYQYNRSISYDKFREELISIHRDNFDGDTYIETPVLKSIVINYEINGQGYFVVFNPTILDRYIIDGPYQIDENHEEIFVVTSKNLLGQEHQVISFENGRLTLLNKGKQGLHMDNFMLYFYILIIPNFLYIGWKRRRGKVCD